MGERAISKGFTIETWHYGSINSDVPPIFMQNFLHVDITAIGPGLKGDGLLKHLATLDRIGTWLKSQWNGRLLIGSNDQLLVRRCSRYDWPRRPVIIPGGVTPPDLALYLLVEVCEPLLRDSGTVVRRVSVRRGAEVPQSVRISDESVDAYFAQPTNRGLKKIPVDIENSEADLHTTSKPKLYHRWEDDPTRPSELVW